jgi:hypothetical protein
MPETYTETHLSQLNARRVSHEDAELKRAITELESHPEVRRAGVFDKAGIVRAAIELGISDFQDLPKAWQHWHEQTFSPDAIRNAIGKPEVLRGASTPFAQHPEDDQDIAEVDEYTGELNRRQEQYRLGDTTALPNASWGDIEEAAQERIRADRAALNTDSDIDSTPEGPPVGDWQDVEAAAAALFPAAASQEE